MSDRIWERIGALSGLVSAVLFGVALIIFLATDPAGTPRIPDIANGAVAVLMGFVFEAAAVLVPTGVDVTTLYVLSAMSIGLGGAAFTVFFLAVGKVIPQAGALPVVIGALAFVAAAASALGLVSIFVDEGIFNAATGAFGFWVRFGAFVVWLVFASATLTATVGRTTRTRR